MCVCSRLRGFACVKASSDTIFSHCCPYCVCPPHPPLAVEDSAESGAAVIDSPRSLASFPSCGTEDAIGDDDALFEEEDGARVCVSMCVSLSVCASFVPVHVPVPVKLLCRFSTCSGERVVVLCVGLSFVICLSSPFACLFPHALTHCIP